MASNKKANAGQTGYMLLQIDVDNDEIVDCDREIFGNRGQAELAVLELDHDHSGECKWVVAKIVSEVTFSEPKVVQVA